MSCSARGVTSDLSQPEHTTRQSVNPVSNDDDHNISPPPLPLPSRDATRDDGRTTTATDTNAKVSYPATRVEDLSDFFRRFDAGAPVSYGASADFVDDAYNASAHDASTPPAEKCEWSTVRVKIGETSGTANLDVDIRAVSNPAARVGALTVAMWAGYVKELHARMTGEFEGWDRYLDNHIGLFVEAGATLDDYVDPLFQARRRRFLVWFALLCFAFFSSRLSPCPRLQGVRRRSYVFFFLFVTRLYICSGRPL